MTRIKTEGISDWRQYLTRLAPSSQHLSLADRWDYNGYFQISDLRKQEFLAASVALNQMCLVAVEHIIENDMLTKIGLPEEYEHSVKASWEDRHQTICGKIEMYLCRGRLKFSHCSSLDMKGLYESAIVQWHWLQETMPARDQHNSIWQSLVEVFEQLNYSKFRGDALSFLHGSQPDELLALEVMVDAANEAGCLVRCQSPDQTRFEDAAGRPLSPSMEPVKFVYGMFSCRKARMSARAKLLLDQGQSGEWYEQLWTIVYDLPGFNGVLRKLFPRHPLTSMESESSDTRRMLLARTTPRMGTGTPETKLNDTFITTWFVDGEPVGLGLEETDGKARLFAPHIIV